ncbi:hypothetical protein [Bacillus sp. FJAT-45350]|uniref:hypothetical protein n=1 Tax=Bacillus sp. FJAT-45350 TaxID=2011014 RepID=UPI000BB8D8FB|nr:hypothetical protein [Bacillus sp. FJAT-45350]
MEDYGFCRECGKVKEEKSLPYCQTCYEVYRYNFEFIKDFLKHTPTANAMDISFGTNIPIERVLQYIKDGLIRST